MIKCYYKGSIDSGSIDSGKIIIKSAIGEYDNTPPQKNPSNRYSLTISLDTESQKELTVIMFNPSEKNIKNRTCSENNPIDLTQNGKTKTFIDRTITNVIIIAFKCNYSKIIILNLFSKIDSDPSQIISNPTAYMNKENKKELENVLRNSNDVLVAWGNLAKKKKKGRNYRNAKKNCVTR